MQRFKLSENGRTCPPLFETLYFLKSSNSEIVEGILIFLRFRLSLFDFFLSSKNENSQKLLFLALPPLVFWRSETRGERDKSLGSEPKRSETRGKGIRGERARNYIDEIYLCQI